MSINIIDIYKNIYGSCGSCGSCGSYNYNSYSCDCDTECDCDADCDADCENNCKCKKANSETVRDDGCFCRNPKCNTFLPMAEPDEVGDGKTLCYKCRNPW